MTGFMFITWSISKKLSFFQDSSFDRPELLLVSEIIKTDSTSLFPYYEMQQSACLLIRILIEACEQIIFKLWRK
jgi:hypothetical protein